MFQFILLPLSPRPLTTETVETVQSLAISNDSRVVLLRMVDGEPSAKPGPPSADQELLDLRRRLDAAGVASRVVERAGLEKSMGSASLIAEVAAELNVDVIVMGGSGVNQVIELASCPVLVVPS